MHLPKLPCRLGAEALGTTLGHAMDARNAELDEHGRPILND